MNQRDRTERQLIRIGKTMRVVEDFQQALELSLMMTKAGLGLSAFIVSKADDRQERKRAKARTAAPVFTAQDLHDLIRNMPRDDSFSSVQDAEVVTD